MLVTEANESVAAQQQAVVALQAQLSAAEGSVAERQRMIVSLESQLSAQTAAFQEADVAAQRAQQALLDVQQLEKHRTDIAEELAKTQAVLQSQSKLAQQQQAELQQSTARQSDLTQQVAELTQQLSMTTQNCSQLTQEQEVTIEGRSPVAAQLQCSQAHNGSLQESIGVLEQLLASSISSRESLSKSVEELTTTLAVFKAERAAAAEEVATLKQKYAESTSLYDKLSLEMDQLTQGSASSAQLLRSEADQQAERCRKLQQQLQEAQEAAGLHRAAAEQLQCVLNAAQEGSTQLKQKINRLTQQLSSQADAHVDAVALLQTQAQALTHQLQTQQQAHAAESGHQLKAQAEAHSAELSEVTGKHARAQSKAEHLLTELQSPQQSCQALLKQAGDIEAEASHLKSEAQELRSSLQDRDDLILDLDTQIKVGAAGALLLLL